MDDPTRKLRIGGGSSAGVKLFVFQCEKTLFMRTPKYCESITTFLLTIVKKCCSFINLFFLPKNEDIDGASQETKVDIDALRLAIQPRASPSAHTLFGNGRKPILRLVARLDF